MLDGDQLKDVRFRRDVVRLDAEEDDRALVVVEQTVVVVGGRAAELLEFGQVLVGRCTHVDPGSIHVAWRWERGGREPLV